MDKNCAWEIFFKSGKIIDYINYSNIQNNVNLFLNLPKNQGDLNTDADNNRCYSYKGKAI